MAPRDVRVGELDVAVTRAADHDASLFDLAAAAVPAERDELGLDAELLRRDRLRRLRRYLGLVDHRGARPEIGDGLALFGTAAVGVNHARRNAELADVEIRIGLHHHTRRREQRVLLAPGVLGEVFLQLAAQVLLVALELLPVAR
jgi:hypothetical protein